MRSAICTKYLGATDMRGARVKAMCDAKSQTYAWDHSLNPEENHRNAAQSLSQALNWGGVWAGGTIGGEYFWITGEPK